MPSLWIGVVAFVVVGVAVASFWLYFNDIKQSLPDEFEPGDNTQDRT